MLLREAIVVSCYIKYLPSKLAIIHFIKDKIIPYMSKIMCQSEKIPNYETGSNIW